MKKALVIIIITILILTGFYFFWRNQQKELIQINQTLPEGIEITKTIFGKYKLNNKIDQYSFVTPDQWEGIEYVEYIPEEIREGYQISSINIEGKVQDCRLIAINKFKNNNEVSDLKNWANQAFEDFNLRHNFENHQINNKSVVVTRENPDLINMDVYFLQENDNIYSIMGGSPQFIEEIIISGKW
jgi:hypothetical protein